MAFRAMAFHATPWGRSAWVLAMTTIASDLIGVQHGPFERLHAAKRSAGDGGEPRDADLVQERPFRADHVGDGDDRKIQSVDLTGRRVLWMKAPSFRGSLRAGWC